VVFLSILAGAELLGLVGALLAVPVAAAVAVLLQHLQAPPAKIRALDSPSAEELDAA
jgi:predicted PurR-regulated permease PerM